MGGNNEFFENFERNKYLKELPSMQRVKILLIDNFQIMKSCSHLAPGLEFTQTRSYFDDLTINNITFCWKIHILFLDKILCLTNYLNHLGETILTSGQT